MTWTVNTCLVILAIICLWQDDEVAEGCSCLPRHPQEHFCKSDVVIKARVISGIKIGITHYGPITSRGYNIKKLKTFKGGCIKFSQVYTAASSATCGVNLVYGKDYLLSGTVQNGRLQISLCNLNVLWNSLTSSQKQGVTFRYEKGCTCKITRCSSLPCAISSKAECLWGFDQIEKKLFGTRTSDYACVKNSDGACTWCKEKNNCLDSDNS